MPGEGGTGNTEEGGGRAKKGKDGKEEAEGKNNFD